MWKCAWCGSSRHLGVDCEKRSTDPRMTILVRKRLKLFAFDRQAASKRTVFLPGICLVDAKAAKESEWKTLRREKAHRAAATFHLQTKLDGPPKLPVRVTITKVGGKAMTATGLLLASQYIRSSVAKWLGVGFFETNRVQPVNCNLDEQIIWSYRQESGGRGVKIEFEPGAAGQLQH